MNTFTTTTWVCIALANAVVVGGAFYTLLWLARRELAGREAPPGLADLLRTLAARVVRLIEQPPTWRAVWTHPKVRVAAVGLPVGALIAVSGWVLWSHAGTWFASAPQPAAHHASSDLPYEAMFDRLAHSIVLWCRVLGMLVLSAAGACTVLGNGRSGFALLVAACTLFGASAAISVVSGSGSDVGLVEAGEPASADILPVPEAATTAAEEPTAGDALTTSSVSASSTEQQSVVSPSTPAHVHGASNHEGSHFGLDDALMLYGAYHLLSGDRSESGHAGRARHEGDAYEGHVTEPNRARAAATKAAATQSTQSSAATTYTRHEGTVSAIRTRSGTARATSFRKGR